MADMMNKFVLFLVVDGFEDGIFKQLWNCFGNLNASTRIASFIADAEIQSQDNSINTHSDMSFAEAAEQNFDVVVVADGITANVIKDDLPAQTALSKAFGRNVAIVSVGDGALALMGADIVREMTIAAPPELEQQLRNARAQISDEPIAVSNNIFSARRDADMQVLCSIVSDFITTKREQAA